jgi:uncharacterized membrane protein
MERGMATESPVTTKAEPPGASRRLPKIIRIMMVRPRLFVSIGVGFLVFLALLLADTTMLTRALVAWDVCLVLYLVLAFRLAAQSKHEQIRRRARLQDEGQSAILMLTAIAAFASLAAIFALLGSGTRAPVQLALATLTIVLSWAFTHTMFGLHYAHEYYDEDRGKGGGLEFPGEEAPHDYWDFFYFSFVIGMCAQVSDITVSDQSIRRTVFAHSIISFIFNAALLALTVNIAASAISTSPG